jgi:hypothetical protein
LRTLSRENIYWLFKKLIQEVTTKYKYIIKNGKILNQPLVNDTKVTLFHKKIHFESIYLKKIKSKEVRKRW